MSSQPKIDQRFPYNQVVPTSFPTLHKIMKFVLYWFILASQTLTAPLLAFPHYIRATTPYSTRISVKDAGKVILATGAIAFVTYSGVTVIKQRRRRAKLMREAERSLSVMETAKATTE